VSLTTADRPFQDQSMYLYLYKVHVPRTTAIRTALEAQINLVCVHTIM
jgi:hypothetical protein